jgi:hypothetical protein
MPLVARQPLADCEVAYRLLKEDGKESLTWRVHWVSCLALLRTVGHVLDKVDGATDARHRTVIDDAWAHWKTKPEDNAVFWRFIKAERNNLLKQYQFGVVPEHTYYVTEDGDPYVTESGDAYVTEDDFFRMSLQGFEDQEGRDVIAEAIKWWHLELDRIEAQF